MVSRMVEFVAEMCRTLEEVPRIGRGCIGSMSNAVEDDRVRQLWQAMTVEEREFLAPCWNDYRELVRGQNALYESASDLHTTLRERLEQAAEVGGPFHAEIKAAVELIRRKLIEFIDDSPPLAVWGLGDVIHRFTGRRADGLRGVEATRMPSMRAQE